MLRTTGFGRKDRHGNDPCRKAGQQAHHIVLVVVEQQQRALSPDSLLLQRGGERPDRHPQPIVAEHGFHGRPFGALRYDRQCHVLASRGRQSCQALHEVPRRHEAVRRHLKLSRCHKFAISLNVPSCNGRLDTGRPDPARAQTSEGPHDRWARPPGFSQAGWTRADWRDRPAPFPLPAI